MLPANLVFVDLETSGASIHHDRIIEIGILRVEDNKIVGSFNSLVDPQVPIPEEIFQLTGISKIELEKAPSFYQMMDQIQDLLKDAVFVAHNVRFDYCFLKRELSRYEIDFSPKQLCTVKLSRLLYPQFRHHNLDSVIERTGIVCKSRHRAFDDAQVLWEFYQIVNKQFSSEVVEKAIDKILKKPTVPMKIPHDSLDKLPENPGVYIFYGSNNLPLYIGKSINIRKRVLSHFSSDHHSSIELKISQQIEQIKTISTAGELGALLKESSLIKTEQPLFNRRLRQSKGFILLMASQNQSGFATVSAVQSSQINPNDLPNILGVYRSKKQLNNHLVELSKQYGLCEKLLGIDHSVGACFGCRLGKCQGACIGKEHPLKYNLRFDEAFYHYRFKTWPFTGAISITEKSEDRTQIFIFDKWCHLATIEISEDSQQVNLEKHLNFDLDVYKILKSYLSSAKDKNIKPLKSVDEVINRETLGTLYSNLA